MSKICDAISDCLFSNYNEKTQKKWKKTIKRFLKENPNAYIQTESGKTINPVPKINIVNEIKNIEL